MAGKVGKVVVYTPTAEQAANFNNHSAQTAAIITSWDEETEKASLAIFVPNATYVATVAGVVEGTEPGNFQQSSEG